MAESAARSDAVGEVVGEFEVTRWEEAPYDEPADGPRLTRVTVHKTFRGAIDGTSIAELLTAQGGDGRGYVASERFTGSIAGRQGTVVFQHGGLDDGHTPTTCGQVVPGSGTGDLAGLAGSVSYAHDDSGARVTLVLG